MGARLHVRGAAVGDGLQSTVLASLPDHHPAHAACQDARELGGGREVATLTQAGGVASLCTQISVGRMQIIPSIASDTFALIVSTPLNANFPRDCASAGITISGNQGRNRGQQKKKKKKKKKKKNPRPNEHHCVSQSHTFDGEIAGSSGWYC